MSKDYYAMLGVEKGASQDEIKKAFRKKAHQYHPDKPSGDEAKFKEINEAYQVLGDEQKRQQYNQFGSAAFDGSGGFGGGQGFGGFQGNINMDDLGDIFGDMFGFGGGQRSRAPRGGDIQVDVDLEFKESIFGKEHEFTLTKPSACERCAGNGAEPGSAMNTCHDCDGQGVKVSTQQTMLGAMQVKRACTTCEGRGETPDQTCTTCHGSGVQTAKKTLSVNIPEGVENGSILRIRGEGEAIKGGDPGDLFVRIHVRPDERFERHGATLVSRAEIGFTQAALGDKIDVDTVDGKVELKIPAGTQPGAQFKLRGKGVPIRGSRGDQIVIVNIKIPKKLSRNEKKLVEELNLREE